MVLASVAQLSFTSGELGRSMRGRFDLPQYASGLERMENFIAETQGTARFRDGFRYVATTKDSNPAALWPFSFNDEQSYILEFTAGVIRIYTDEGILESGGSPVEVVSPYTVDEIFELQFTQTADTMYIAHRNHNPRLLTRTSATTWTLTLHSPSGITFGVDDYPGAVTFYEQRLYYAGSNNNPQTLFGSKAGDFNDFTIGTNANDGLSYTIGSNDVNLIRSLISTSRQMVVITNGGSFVVRGGQGDEPITPTSISIKPGDGIGGENQRPVLKNNRILFTQRGQRILRSFEYTLATDGYQSIDRNLLSADITVGGIKQLAFQEGRPEVCWCAQDSGELLGVTFKPEENVTGWHRHSTRQGDEITSVAVLPRDGNFDQVWVVTERSIDGSTEYYVEFMEDSPEYPEPEEFFTGGDNRETDEANFRNLLLERQKDYVHVDSALTFDGTLVGFDAGATLTPGATTGSAITFTASASVFTSGMVGRQLWRKSITGEEIGRAEITTFTSGTVVECTILVDFDSTDAIPAGEWYLTSDSLSGLSHLEGETVKVVTDGAIHPDVTVSSGEISLNYQASVVHVGLPYRGIMKSMNIEAGGVNGPSQTRFKNSYKLGFKFLDTLGAQFGTNLYRLEQLLFRSTNSFLNSPPELFTGEKRVAYSDSWSGPKNIYVIQDFALPCRVQMVVPYLNTSST